MHAHRIAGNRVFAVALSVALLMSLSAGMASSQTFDANQVHRDILRFKDWLSNELAEAVRAFWSAAISDANATTISTGP